MFLKNKKTCMEREIFAQSEILSHLLKTYIADDGNIMIDVPQGIETVVLVASGSSYNSARYAADLFGDAAGIEARAIYSSEFLLKSTIPHSDKMLYVFITQSGETSDTNKALNKAKEFGVTTLAITNKQGSTIWKASDYKIDCHAGEEKSIAATKSLTAQMFCLTILVLKYAQFKGVDISKYLDEIRLIPEFVNKTYLLQPKIKVVAKFISKYKNVVITADGISYSIAKEAALKIRETSYINVTSYILGEFMHGHVAVLNNKAVLMYLTIGEMSYISSRNLNKIKEDYNPPLCVIGNTNKEVKTNFRLNIETKSEIVKAFCELVIIQLLALETAKKLRRNVDKPHGLNKVVI